MTLEEENEELKLECKKLKANLSSVKCISKRKQALISEKEKENKELRSKYANLIESCDNIRSELLNEFDNQKDVTVNQKLLMLELKRVLKMARGGKF